MHNILVGFASSRFSTIERSCECICEHFPFWFFFSDVCFSLRSQKGIEEKINKTNTIESASENTQRMSAVISVCHTIESHRWVCYMFTLCYDHFLYAQAIEQLCRVHNCLFLIQCTTSTSNFYYPCCHLPYIRRCKPFTTTCQTNGEYAAKIHLNKWFFCLEKITGFPIRVIIFKVMADCYLPFACLEYN